MLFLLFFFLGYLERFIKNYGKDKYVLFFDKKIFEGFAGLELLLWLFWRV